MKRISSEVFGKKRPVKKRTKVQEIITEIKLCQQSRRLEYLLNINDDLCGVLYSQVLNKLGPKAAMRFIEIHDRYACSEDEHRLVEFENETWLTLAKIEEKQFQRRLIKLAYFRYFIGSKNLVSVTLDLNLNLIRVINEFKSKKFKRENRHIRKLGKIIKGA